jgi:apolipoprotein N-acyltransferase
MVDVARQAPVDAPADGQPAPDPAGLRRLGGWWALVAALAAGPIMLVAFPPYDLWWAAPVGVALLGAAAFGRGFWWATGLGMLTGVTFFVPLLNWAGGYVGPVWLILPVAEAGYIAVLAGISAVCTPVVQRWRWTLPLVTGAVWVLQEALRDRTPFGGFPWGRLAFAQGESPLLGLAALGGAPLVTFGVAALGGVILLIVDIALRVRTWHWRQSAVRAITGAAALGLVLVAGPLLVPSPAAGGATVQVAIVQGNVPRLGLDFNAQRRAVLDNHVNATLALARDVTAGTAAAPDFVVWPENASDIDPLANLDAKARIDEAANAIGVPILVGGLLHGPGPKDIRNVGIVWEPGVGPTHTYVKRHPVPFAEYMPIRSFARMITDKVDLVRSDFVAGPTPGVMPIDGAVIGDVICFEVAYDEVVRDTVTGGAGLLVVQTNNATFNEAEARQQLAMVQLRAVEHGRPALMASTVGVSAFVDEAGNVYDATPFNAPALISREVNLGTSRTIATRVGPMPELALAVVAIGVLAVAVVQRRSRRKEAH